MSENDVTAPPSPTFDSPQKIVKKIIYSPTSAFDMQYDSLAHIDTLMGERGDEEDLVSLTIKNEYSFSSPSSPDFPNMKESLVIRARIYDEMEVYKVQKLKTATKSEENADQKPPSNPITAKLDFIKQTPNKITKKVKDSILKITQQLNAQNPVKALKKSLASFLELREKAQEAVQERPKSRQERPKRATTAAQGQQLVGPERRGRGPGGSEALRCYAGYHLSAPDAPHSSGERLQSTFDENPAGRRSVANRGFCFSA